MQEIVKDLSIAIPCYNEQDNLDLLLEKLRSLNSGDTDFEVLLVDNGSTDNSRDLLKKKLVENNMSSDHFRIVEIDVNQGYGYGILRGLDAARGRVLAWTHADLQTNPQDVFRAYQLYSAKSQQIMVKGKRRHRPLLDEAFTFGMQLVAYAFLRVYLDDINAQPKLFSRDFYLEHRPKAPFDFSLDLFYLYKAKTCGIPIETVDVTFEKRLYGEAKGGGSLKTKWKLIKRTFSYIRELSFGLV